MELSRKKLDYVIAGILLIIGIGLSFSLVNKSLFALKKLDERYLNPQYSCDKTINIAFKGTEEQKSILNKFYKCTKFGDEGTIRISVTELPKTELDTICKEEKEVGCAYYRYQVKQKDDSIKSGSCKVYINKDLTGANKVFALLHEIGHCFLLKHKDKGVMTAVLNKIDKTELMSDAMLEHYLDFVDRVKE